MKQPMSIVALRTVRYSDTHSVLSAYSREAGRVAFLVPVGGRDAARRRALMQPLGVVDCMARFEPGHELGWMSEPRASVALHSIGSNPLKATIAMFLAEVMGATLRTSEADPAMFDFIVHGVLTLDSLPAGRLANFHICFLMGLGRMLGIAPDTSTYRRGAFFDMADACFRITPPLHPDFLEPDEARGVALASLMTYRNMHRLRLSADQRCRMLDVILRFLSLHLAPLGTLRSLQIVRTLLH